MLNNKEKEYLNRKTGQEVFLLRKFIGKKNKKGVKFTKKMWMEYCKYKKHKPNTIKKAPKQQEIIKLDDIKDIDDIIEAL